MTHLPMGSVSHGTLRTEDLIEAFSETLLELAGTSSLDTKCQAWLSVESDSLPDDALSDHEDTGYQLVQELEDALQEFAPPYFYFGAHPGDGSDFGFWLYENFQQDFEGLQVSDTSEVAQDYSGEVLHVNDHGNVTLYAANNGTLTEVWSVT